MRNKYYCIIGVLLFALSCCRKDNNPSVFNEDSYPLAVGDWWQYKLTSSTGTDTFMLSAVSVSSSGPYTNYKCYLIIDGNVTDSGYFMQSDTSLSFVNTSIAPDYSSFQSFHLKFPVTTGQYWQGAFPGDSTMVASVASTYSSYGHTYGPCYYTRESYDLPHNFKVNNMILTPKIGLIYQSITFNSDTAEPIDGIPGVQIQQSITLINYHVQ